MQGERAAMVGIALGFLPWMMFWSLSGAGWPLPGALLALAATIGIYMWQGRRLHFMGVTAASSWSMAASAEWR